MALTSIVDFSVACKKWVGVHWDFLCVFEFPLLRYLDTKWRLYEEWMEASIPLRIENGEMKSS